jgi:hypothetical protein
MNILWYGLIVLQVLYSSGLVARFSHRMVDHFDLNENIEDEHYIDIISYQQPFVWDSFWRKSLNSYRASSGSLDYRRYNYLGDIKLYTKNNNLVRFEYTQRSEETLADFFAEQKVKILFNVHDKFYISLITEPETYKKFADYGASLSYETSPEDRMEIYYWAIDFEYNNKETIKTDEYSKKSYTIGTNITHENKKIYFNLNLEYDSPHIWNRKSKGYQYEYANLRKYLTFILHLDDTQSLKIKSDYYKRTDRKDWKYLDSTAPGGQYRYLNRTKWELLLSSVFYRSSSVVELGMKVVFLKTKEHKNVVDTINEDIEVAIFNKDVERKEIGPFATINFPVTKYLHSQYGVFLHHINKSNKKSIQYAKLQTALDFRINNNLFILANVTWRLHRMFEKNPSTRNPWGGGNLQFMYNI